MRWRVLAHPWCAGAVAVLAVNDQVLKRTVPSWWTGKLSDVAGAFLLGVVLGAALGRPRLGVALAAVAFTALKVVPGVAEAVAPVLGGVTRRDGTDLLALGALWPALRFLDVRIALPGERGVLEQLVVIVAGAALVLATTADSCYARPSIDAFVLGADGTVFARSAAPAGSEGYTDPKSGWAVSRDGGVTWRRAGRPTGTVLERREACGDLGCFRSAGMQVEARPVGDVRWRTSFAYTPEQQRRMRARSNESCGTARVDRFGTVVVIDRRDGEHVLVAAGTQGAVRRSPGGRWTRVGVLGLDPLSTAPVYDFGVLFLAPLVVMLAGVGLLVVGIARRRSTRGAIGLAISWGGSIAIAVVMGFFLEQFRLTIWAGPTVLALSIGVFVAALVVTWRDPGRTPHP